MLQTAVITDVDDIVVLREFIALELKEIVRRCGSKWCLYSKKKDANGRHRRLGTHDTKQGAVDQERAIKAHGG